MTVGQYFQKKTHKVRKRQEKRQKNISILDSSEIVKGLPAELEHSSKRRMLRHR